MIKAIIFDCFGVLYVPAGEDFYRSHIANYEERRAELQDLGAQANYGLISQEELVKQVAKLGNLAAKDVAIGIVGQQVRNQELLDFSQTLRPAYKVGLLSNISADTMDTYFTLAERQTFFDDAVLSSEVGMVKPHPEIFELAAQRLRVDSTECLFIDDLPDNCSGAQAVGMQAIVFKDTKQAIAAVSEHLR